MEGGRAATHEPKIQILPPSLMISNHEKFLKRRKQLKLSSSVIHSQFSVHVWYHAQEEELVGVVARGRWSLFCSLTATNIGVHSFSLSKVVTLNIRQHTTIMSSASPESSVQEFLAQASTQADMLWNRVTGCVPATAATNGEGGAERSFADDEDLWVDFAAPCQVCTPSYRQADSEDEGKQAMAVNDIAIPDVVTFDESEDFGDTISDICENRHYDPAQEKYSCHAVSSLRRQVSAATEESFVEVVGNWVKETYPSVGGALNKFASNPIEEKQQQEERRRRSEAAKTRMRSKKSSARCTTVTWDEEEEEEYYQDYTLMDHRGHRPNVRKYVHVQEDEQGKVQRFKRMIV